ncbi:MAG TPA: hypothetical protein VK509_01665, partial [Polyangiales bacterium]|nr:hypothetical protein [Polyangiales bacterium]
MPTRVRAGTLGSSRGSAAGTTVWSRACLACALLVLASLGCGDGAKDEAPSGSKADAAVAQPVASGAGGVAAAAGSAAGSGKAGSAGSASP